MTKSSVPCQSRKPLSWSDSLEPYLSCSNEDLRIGAFFRDVVIDAVERELESTRFTGWT